jgi:hypothetical protein
MKDGGGCLEPEMNGHMKHVTTDIIACIVFGNSYEKGKKMFKPQHALVNLLHQR